MIEDIKRKIEEPFIRALAVIFAVLIGITFWLMWEYEDEELEVDLAVISVGKREVNDNILEKYGKTCLYSNCTEKATHGAGARMEVDKLDIEFPNKANFSMESKQEQKYVYGYEAYKQYGLDGDYSIEYRNTSPTLTNGDLVMNFFGIYCDEHIESALDTLRDEVREYKESQASIWHTWSWAWWPYNIIIIIMLFSIAVVLYMLGMGDELTYEYLGSGGVLKDYILPLLPLVGIILIETFMDGGWASFLILICGIFLNAVFRPIEAAIASIKKRRA